MVTRRSLLGSVAAMAVLPRLVWAEDYVDLDWDDLLPKDAPRIPNAVRSLARHDETSDLFGQQPASSGVRTDWNGQVVRLPGFIVPIEFVDTRVSAFILVPYVGACVHVPPPPANQLVFVTTPEPYESKGLYEAVNVIGMFGTASVTTQLAQVGYALSADQILPFG